MPIGSRLLKFWRPFVFRSSHFQFPEIFSRYLKFREGNRPATARFPVMEQLKLHRAWFRGSVQHFYRACAVQPDAPAIGLCAHAR